MSNIDEQIQEKNKEIYHNKIVIDTEKNVETFNLTVSNLIDIMFFKNRSINKDRLREYKEEIKKILYSRNDKLIKMVSDLDSLDVELEKIVDEVSFDFSQDIEKLSFSEKILKKINKKIIEEEKIKSISLRNSYSDTKKYIENIDKLNSSVEKGKVRVYQKEPILKSSVNEEESNHEVN